MTNSTDSITYGYELVPGDKVIVGVDGYDVDATVHRIRKGGIAHDDYIEALDADGCVHIINMEDEVATR